MMQNETLKFVTKIKSKMDETNNISMRNTLYKNRSFRRNVLQACKLAQKWKRQFNKSWKYLFLFVYFVH